MLPKNLITTALKFLINFLTNIGLMIIGVLITISILSYNKFDPSLNTSSDDLSNNLISYPGSYAADLLIQAFGFASILISIRFGLAPHSTPQFAEATKLFGDVQTISFSPIPIAIHAICKALVALFVAIEYFAETVFEKIDSNFGMTKLNSVWS